MTDVCGLGYLPRGDSLNVNREKYNKIEVPALAFPVPHVQAIFKIRFCLTFGEILWIIKAKAKALISNCYI